MPRSYRYDHFQNSGKDEHLIHSQEKQRVALAQVEPGVTGFHYGSRFAETKRRGHQKFEELAFATRTEKLGEEYELQLEKPTIGSLPNEEPLEEEKTFLGLWGDANRYLKMATLASRDMAVAGWKLLHLPLETARLLKARVAALGGLPQWS